jgi:hypothetical protein
VNAKLTRWRARKVAWCMLALALCSSRAALAQSGRPLQLGMGYEFLHESVDRGGDSFPIGVYAAVEQRLTSDSTKAWNWLAQFETGRRRDDGFSEQIYTVLGGIRLASTKPMRWTPSGFGLLGMAMLNSLCEEYCDGTTSAFALQGGFTLSTPLHKSLLLDLTFKATKLTVNGGAFNTAGSAGLRFNLEK